MQDMMTVTHDLSFPHFYKDSMARSEQIHLALGHGDDLKLKADYAEDVVHGKVRIDFCDTRTFGEHVLFRDAHMEEITERNIERYFQDQGHRLVSIVGDQAFGNTIVMVGIYEEEDAPRHLLSGRPEGGFYHVHDSHWKRPTPFPTEEDIHQRLDAMGLMPSIEELDLRQLERNYKIR
jgi:hypothetical protein